MKKFPAIILAAACTLTVCSFAACGESTKDSDIVTQTEWLSAMMLSKFLNVSVDMKGSESYTYTDGTTETAEINGAVKNNFILNSSTGVITGNAYMYSSASYSDDYSYTGTYYEAFTESSYSYVEKYSESGVDEWYGHSYSTAGTADDSECYGIRGVIDNYIDRYSDFEYVDGAYQYVDTYEINGNGYYESLNYAVYIKINDGYITSLIIEENDYDYSSNYSTNSTSREEYTFYDYGTTTVTIPTEYTYEYYSANNA